MLEKISELWNDYGFEIVLGLCVVFILIFALIRLGKKGTWDAFYRIPVIPKKRRRPPPKESRGEAECRRVLQDIFKRSFAKARPDFLRNPVTGNMYNCEIDCFNPEMNLGVEYNGQQHYKYIPYFHKNKEAFYNQKYRDELKARMCRDYGVNLIEVPYTVKVHEIRSYLIKALRNLGYIS